MIDAILAGNEASADNDYLFLGLKVIISGISSLNSMRRRHTACPTCFELNRGIEMQGSKSQVNYASQVKANR